MSSAADASNVSACGKGLYKKKTPVMLLMLKPVHNTHIYLQTDHFEIYVRKHLFHTACI